MSFPKLIQKFDFGGNIFETNNPLSSTNGKQRIGTCNCLPQSSTKKSTGRANIQVNANECKAW